jgi:acetyl-CoA carboxylase biotin carboxylase subunit
MRRVLVANRGEIAVRIIRACRESSLESVAVYSDADERALHARLADRAVRIGPSPARDSYLNIPAIIAAARESRADAVHPGYGFLSERAAFAQACDAAGLVFVGPPAEVIDRMGSKIAARELMDRAGVPVVPGLTPADQSDDGIAAAVNAIGYPVLIKASAGGGGKGMRTVRTDAETRAAIPSARREAMAAFGDGTLYAERRIDRPRHVEIQILADARGNVIHLFERECSLQRRHQKILEESPSPALSPRVRAQMGEAAVAASRAAGYRNAGTIEFLLEGEGDSARFYFLEMNTRLQVEHPVTEAVTGIDLVRAQLLVAAGHPLPWTQEMLTQRGHAVECRVYAEDPAQGFLPQAGRLALYREPAGPGVRVDSGVVEGDTIGVNYDPLVAKVIGYAESREAALNRVSAALRRFPILGIRTNLPFLVRLIADSRVRSGATHTGFVDAHEDELTAAPKPPAVAVAAAALLAERPSNQTMTSAEVEAPDPWSTLHRWGR